MGDEGQMKQEHYRVCSVCGRRHGPTYGFQSKLNELGIKGIWAAPDCVAKLEAERRLQRAQVEADLAKQRGDYLRH